MKKILLLSLGVVLISCEKNDPLADIIDVYETALTDTTTTINYHTNYQFSMVGRCQQDNNGYYHLPLIEGENQTLHRFGAYTTNKDIYGLPTQVIWTCDVYWELSNNNIPVVNGTSFADPNVDSVFCMMAPIFEMQGDTITIYGEAWFEEGDIIIKDSLNIILE